MNAMTQARKHAHENKCPVIVHASVVRIHSHSKSTNMNSIAMMSGSAHWPMADSFERYRKTLIASGRVAEAELDELDKKAKEEVSKAHKKALAAPDPDPASIFDFVIPAPYPALKYPDGLHTLQTGEAQTYPGPQSDFKS